VAPAHQGGGPGGDDNAGDVHDDPRGRREAGNKML